MVQYAEQVAGLQNESAEQMRASNTGNAQLKATQSRVRFLVSVIVYLMFEHEKFDLIKFCADRMNK